MKTPKNNDSQLTITATEQTVQRQEITPYSLIEMAMSKPDFDIEKLERLLQMQKDYEDRKSRKEFFEALKKFQYECPVIKKNGGADFVGKGSNVKYNFATLDQIVSQIKEPLNNCGLTYRFDVAEENAVIKITCVITHVNGHSERTTMTAGADATGAKNAIQAKGSTLTYLQRYTLIGSLGITTADADDDGHKSEDPNNLSDEMMLAIKVCNNQNELQMLWDGYTDLHKSKPFINAVKQRKAELNGK